MPPCFVPTHKREPAGSSRRSLAVLPTLRNAGWSGVKPPSPLPTMNTPFGIVRYKRLLSYLTAMPPTRCASCHCEPMGQSAPLSSMKQLTKVEPLAYKKRPSSLTANEIPGNACQFGIVNGEPSTGLSAPLNGSIRKTEIEPEPSLAEKSRLRGREASIRCANSEPNAGARPKPPLAYGDPAMGELCPSWPTR